MAQQRTAFVVEQDNPMIAILDEDSARHGVDDRLEILDNETARQGITSTRSGRGGSRAGLGGGDRATTPIWYRAGERHDGRDSNAVTLLLIV